MHPGPCSSAPSTTRTPCSTRLTSAPVLGRPAQVHTEAIAGYVDVLDGRTVAGIDRVQRALAARHGADHAPGLQASIMRIILESCLVASDARSGLTAADQAIEMAGPRLWEAEARRLRAEFLARLGASPGDVQKELERALQVARRQGARALELRIAISTLRLRQACGERSSLREAHAALQAILAEMPEGRGTRDFDEAASLLR